MLIEWLKEDIAEIKEGLGMNAVVGFLYFTAFAGLIISVCLLGVNGDWLWGVVTLLCSVILIVIGLVTGTL